jgi:hypothetical protein
VSVNGVRAEGIYLTQPRESITNVQNVKRRPKMKLTIKSATRGLFGKPDRVLDMPGQISDEVWKERQQVCEERFKNRKPDTMTRRGGTWVTR